MQHKPISPKLFFILLLVFLLPGGSAAVTTVANASSIPAAAVLNADGTLNPGAGVSGALDLTGWDVNLDPQRGPVLKPEVSGAWSALNSGLSGSVGVIAIVGTDVYVGGSFTAICGNAACDSGNSAMNRVARWSSATHTWSALGSGLNNLVTSLAVSGGDVYAGGYFDELCGNGACDSGNTRVNRIAKWSSATNTWSPLGNGLNSQVYAVAVSGSDVYAAGWFTQVCGNAACDSGNTTVNRIAKWSSGTGSWSPLGNGVSGVVYQIAVNGSDVYAGGSFTQACGNAACDSGNTTVNRIAKWSSATNSWAGLANGVNGSVYAVVARDGNIYLGGAFSQTCVDPACSNSPDTAVNRLVKWSPVTNSWARLGNGVGSGILFALAMNGNEMYVGGGYLYTCGNSTCTAQNTTVNRIAKFTIAACAAPVQPVMLAPVKNGTTNKTRPLLQWTNPGCVQTYNVTVKDKATGATVFSKTGLSAYQVKTTKLTHGKTYKWFVKGCVGNTCTKSLTWKFTVK